MHRDHCLQPGGRIGEEVHALMIVEIGESPAAGHAIILAD
jgi:hypothetical protein